MRHINSAPLKGRRGKKHIAGGLLTLALAVSTALAQQKVAFDIPAQPASAAIQTWARASGLQVFAAEEHLQGIRTNSVHGDYTPIEAMQLMVQGTGLEVVASSENTVTIRRANPRDMPGTPPDERFNAGQLMEVVVTGTRIKRSGFDTLQNATVTDSQQIERRGYTNVAQALNALPTFGDSGADVVGSEQGTHSVGQSFVDLFNLGSQRTLVLVNGRRYVSSKSPALDGAAGAQVDLNTIPVGLVDRVEVVSIGGAPVYGSDAIAGTVNIILKRDYEGFDASAQYGDTEAGGGENKTFRALMGGNFMEDRGNIAVGIEYNESEGLLYADRFPEFYTLIPNAADTGPNDGIPERRVGTVRFAPITEGGLPHANTLAPILGGGIPGITLPPFFTRPNYIYDAAGQPLQFGPSGDLIPFNLGTVVQSAAGGALPVQTTGGDGMNLADHFSLLSPTQRTLINAIGHFDINDHVRAIFEASYAHTRGKEISEFYSFAGPGVFGGPRLTYSVNNPFLSPQARDILIANLGPDATFDVNRNLSDLTDVTGGRTTVDLYRLVGGLEGGFDAFGERLSWDVSFNYGRSRGVSELTYINPDRLLQAIDATVDDSGVIVCRDPRNGCAPLDLFGVNNFSREALQFVSDPAAAITVNTQKVATANLGGNLPFGIAAPIAFNLGYEHREETGSFSPDSAFKAGGILIGQGTAGATLPISGSFETDEAYTELMIPMISDETNVPFIKTASLEGAVRYVDHSLTGGGTTWSAGGRIAPRVRGWADGLLFRGVYTEAIRSPAITELFANTPVTERIDDPCSSEQITSGPNPAARAANCAAALAAVGVADPGSFNSRNTTGVISPAGTQVGNPDLDNEIAESWSVGLVFQPAAWPNFRMAIDWTDIELDGGIQPIGIGRRVASCYDSNTFPNSACDGFSRYTAADIAALPPNSPARQVGDLANGFEQTYVNLSKIDFEGLIVSAQSVFNVGPGAASVGTTVFYTAKFEEIIFEGDEPVDYSGTRDAPKYSVQFNLGYRWNQVDIDWQTLWKTAVDTGYNVDPEFLTESRIPSYALHNVTVGYQFTEALRAQFGAVNVLDEDIPVNALPGGFSGYDPIGRRYFVTLFTHF